MLRSLRCLSPAFPSWCHCFITACPCVAVAVAPCTEVCTSRRRRRALVPQRPPGCQARAAAAAAAAAGRRHQRDYATLLNLPTSHLFGCAAPVNRCRRRRSTGAAAVAHTGRLREAPPPPRRCGRWAVAAPRRTAATLGTVSLRRGPRCCATKETGCRWIRQGCISLVPSTHLCSAVPGAAQPKRGDVGRADRAALSLWCRQHVPAARPPGDCSDRNVGGAAGIR